MVPCVSSSCGRLIEDEYAFCPFCGSDNRAPLQRVQVGFHTHIYPEEGKYCATCGCLDELLIERAIDAQQGRKTTLIGGAVLGGALLLFILGSLIDNANYNRMMAERAEIEKAGKLDEGGRGATFQLSPFGPIAGFVGLIGGVVTVVGAVKWINNAKKPDVTDQ